MTTKGTTFTDTKALDTDYNYYWVFPSRYGYEYREKCFLGNVQNMYGQKV